MSYRLLVVGLLVVAGLFGLMGAFGSPLSPPRPTIPLPPNHPDPVAEQTLDRALVAMSPERLGCVETKLWQKVTLPNLTYEADGRYLMGSQRRFRMELRTKQDAAESTRLTVSDGATLWEAKRVGRGEWSNVTKIELAPLLAELEGDGPKAQLRTEFLEGPRFGGVAPLLRNLRWHLNWVKTEKVERQGKARIRLIGVWTPDFVEYIRSEQEWPAGLPEQCRLELDPLTLWPHRLEWWGPLEDGGADTLLAQIEFRDPVVHSTLSPERCAKEFSFQPGSAAVEDLTETIKADYEMRLR
jgi:hypothetical protein